MNRQSAPPGPQRVPATLSTVSRVNDELPGEFLAAPVTSRIGVCCSGGGIRSAAFSLGALQALRESGVLAKAEHLACVSGGGYISIAHAVMVSESRARNPQRSAGFRSLPPYAQQSPEERHLRNNLHYLAPGVSGKIWMVLSLGYAIVRHMVPFLAWIITAGFGYGLLIREAVDDDRLPTNALVGFGLIATGALLLLLIVEVRHHLVLRQASRQRMHVLQRAAVSLTAASALALLLLWCIPSVLIWSKTHNALDIVPFVDKLPAWVPLAGTEPDKAQPLSTVWMLLIVVSSLIPWVLRSTSKPLLRTIAMLLALLSGPLLVLFPFTWAANLALDDTSPLFDYRWYVLVVAAIFAVLAIWWNEVTPRAHLYYRERLATAFIGYRRGLSRSLKYRQPEWSEPLRLSELHTGGGPNRRMPNLIVCAAANLSTDVPPGRAAATFTFEKARIGGPLTGYMPTRQFEDAAGHGVVTLPALMAVSGAMFGPSMGRFSRPALRYLMAFFNLRLGVWLPNPLGRSGCHTATAVRTQEMIVRGLPDVSTSLPETPRRKKPGALYVLWEALGLNDLDRPFVYVSDGGHYENLGLVELLRRGCGQIVCIDASGSKGIDGLMEALLLAESELDVSVTFAQDDLAALVPGETRYAASAVAIGQILYPNKTLGTLHYVRSNLTQSMPAELRSFAERDKRFPRHGTGNQFLSEPLFEAYRRLGHHHTTQAAQAVTPLRT